MLIDIIKIIKNLEQEHTNRLLSDTEDLIDNYYLDSFIYYCHAILRNIYENIDYEDMAKNIRFLINNFRKLKTFKIMSNNCEQRTDAWYMRRHNMVTASDMYKVLKNNKNRHNLLYKKVKPYEKTWRRIKACEWGTKYEDVAKKIYEIKNKTLVHEFSCLPHPKYPFIGASPDGISELGKMLEIKCPYSRKITGIPLDSYYTQMQIQLEVCDYEECDFLECKFIEITKEEYINLNLDSKLNDNPKEEENVNTEYAGCIISLEQNDKLRHWYSEVNLNILDLEKWVEKNICKIKKIAEAINNKNFDIDIECDDIEMINMFLIEVKYWRIDKYSCVVVKRDRDWFNNNIGQITDFWNSVEHYRLKGVDTIPYYQAPLLKKFTKYAFLDD